MIGYVLEQELENRLPGRNVATVLTQTVVDASDPAFSAPSKPIGPVYTAEQARTLAASSTGRSRPTARAGAAWCPHPSRSGSSSCRPSACSWMPACWWSASEGAGFRWWPRSNGALHGVEAVIDKDRSAALLARDLGADALLLLTDVRVRRARPRHEARPPDTRSVRAGSSIRPKFPAGSMRPRVESACRFDGGDRRDRRDRRTGRRCRRSSLEEAGTRIVSTRAPKLRSRPANMPSSAFSSGAAQIDADIRTPPAERLRPASDSGRVEPDSTEQRAMSSPVAQVPGRRSRRAELYFSDPACLEHDPRAQMPEHPDTPERLLAIERPSRRAFGLARLGAPRRAAGVRGGEAGPDPHARPHRAHPRDSRWREVARSTPTRSSESRPSAPRCTPSAERAR